MALAPRVSGNFSLTVFKLLESKLLYVGCGEDPCHSFGLGIQAWRCRHIACGILIFGRWFCRDSTGCAASPG